MSSRDTAGDTDETLETFGSDIGARTNSIARVREWLLVDGDRLIIAGAISLGTFVLLLSLHEVGVVAFVNDDSVTRMASGMAAGTFSLVTLVVSINQLILSQEFSAAGEAEEDLGGVMEFRRDVEDATGVPAAPAEPTKLLALLVDAIDHRAIALSEAVADHPDAAVRDVVLRYANRVNESSDRIDDTLEKTKFGTFGALSAAVAYDDPWQIYAARQLSNRHADALSDDALESFEELIETLRLFAIAREHFKTTYLQRELTRFSQLTIYCGVPAVLTALLIGLLYADFTGPAVSLQHLPVLVSAMIAVVVSPLALLVAYILRTATLTRRTASIGPMIPQKDPDEGPFEVSYGGGSDEPDA